MSHLSGGNSDFLLNKILLLIMVRKTRLCRKGKMKLYKVQPMGYFPYYYDVHVACDCCVAMAGKGQSHSRIAV